MALNECPAEAREIRDPPLASEQELQGARIRKIPTPGKQSEDGGRIIRHLLTEFLRGFSLRTLLFLLDMVLPQLDAYNAGRHMQQMAPWVSVFLEQQRQLHQDGLHLPLAYNSAEYAGVHVVTLCTEGAPLLLFSNPSSLPTPTLWELCTKGDLGSMESNIMAGRALHATFGLENGGQRCALFILLDKQMQGSNKTAAARAYRRIAPKTMELALLPLAVAIADPSPVLRNIF